MTTMPPSALELARPPLPADALSPVPPPFRAATKLAARPMRWRLLLPLPLLFPPPPLLPPPLLLPLASLSTPPLPFPPPLLAPLFLSFLRSSFLTALRSDLFCSRTLTLPSPLMSATCASSVPPAPALLLSLVAAWEGAGSSFAASVAVSDIGVSLLSPASEPVLGPLATSCT